MDVVTHPLTPDRWNDLVAVFEGKGCSMARGCWCMYCRETGRVDPPEGVSASEDRRRRLRALASADPSAGLIAYAEGVPVGSELAGAPTGAGARVRRLVPGEELALAAVMRRSFGGLAGALFHPGKAAFVAELDGRIVGGLTLGAFRIDAARRGGIVKWVFTLPEARGHGVASALVERALAWFDEEGVTDAFACIEGLNAGSSNRFAQHGFAPLGFIEQLRRYGAALPRVWWRTNHVVDVGHVLWARTPAGEADPSLVWGLGGLAATLALLAAFGVVAMVRLGATVDATAVAQIAVAAAAVVGVRTGAMALAGRALGLRLRYLTWETGLLLSAAIALLFGGVFVVPGGLVPRARSWSPSAWRSGLARLAFLGAAAVLALGWLAWWAASAGVAPGVASRVLLYARFFCDLRRPTAVLPDDGVLGPAAARRIAPGVGGAGGGYGRALVRDARCVTGGRAGVHGLTCRRGPPISSPRRHASLARPPARVACDPPTPSTTSKSVQRPRSGSIPHPPMAPGPLIGIRRRAPVGARSGRQGTDTPAK